MTGVIRAGLLACLLALSACGTTGQSVFDSAPSASYVLVTEGEFQGSFTNSSLKGCKVTLGGAISEGEFPFEEFSYTDAGCTLKARTDGDSDSEN
mgnify:CR=1 FL=1